jgi:diguanylate cyclase (GGDEF)-like protein
MATVGTPHDGEWSRAPGGLAAGARAGLELDDKRALLRRTRLLESLSDEQLRALIDSCRTVSLVPGETLCHEGEVGHAMYVVLSGNLVVSKGGKQVAVGRPGDCFGEMALIESRERSATLRALDDTLVLEIPEGAFVSQLSSMPGPLRALLRVFSDRSRHDLESLVSANLKLQAQAQEMDRKNRELNETRRQLEQRNRDLERISALDTLTQIANRHRFDAVLRQEWRRAVRDEAPVSLLFCDIDYFKRFNDTYGHQAGDECLVRVAQAMEETLNRPADLVARYGGEEFIALLVDTDPGGARMLAERMRGRVEELRIENRSSAAGSYLTVSLGVATVIPNPSLRPEDLVDLADRALYASKASGRNRVSCSDQLPALKTAAPPLER